MYSDVFITSLNHEIDEEYFQLSDVISVIFLWILINNKYILFKYDIVVYKVEHACP